MDRVAARAPTRQGCAHFSADAEIVDSQCGPQGGHAESLRDLVQLFRAKRMLKVPMDLQKATTLHTSSGHVRAAQLRPASVKDGYTRLYAHFVTTHKIVRQNSIQGVNCNCSCA
jgi:hypothetical protein